MDNIFRTQEGDRIKGYIGINKNRSNPRQIDVVVSAEHIPASGKTPRINKETKVFEMQ